MTGEPSSPFIGGDFIFILTARDEQILREASRFRGCVSRHLHSFGGFSGSRASYARLKKLIDNGYLERNRYIYGIAGVYRITSKARNQLGINLPISEIRLDQLVHDLTIVDVYLYLKSTLGLSPSDFTTEKEIRHNEGFNTRMHLPDLVYKYDDKDFCVEVELSLKSKERLEKNINDNYINYNGQKWYIKHTNTRLYDWLKEFSIMYPDIEILNVEVIENHN